MLPVAYLELRRMLGEQKVVLLGVFLGIPVLLTVAVRNFGGLTGASQVQSAGIYLFLLYPLMFSMLLALLYGTAVISAELEAKTLTYLFTRPIAKWKIIVSKYAAITALLAVSTVVSLVLSWLILGSPGGWGLIGGLVLATLGAAAVYNAIFAALGTVFLKRAMVIGLIYAVIIEGFLSFVPAVINNLTATYYLRSVVIQVYGGRVSRDLTDMVGDASLSFSLAVLTLMVLLALGAACLVATQREYVVTEQT